jgi:hypothetical protein
MTKINRNAPCPCQSGRKHKKCCGSIYQESWASGGKNFIFCDESGNTGTNWIDPEQPFYVIAGFHVQYSALDQIYQIEKFAKQMNVTGELKGSKLSRNKENLKHFAALIETLGKENILPYFYYVEKKCAVAAKVIEAFLDNQLNTRVDYTLDYQRTVKKQYAQHIYDLPDAVLKKFFNGYFYDSVDETMEVLSEMIQLLKVSDAPLAYRMAGCQPQVESWLVDEFRFNNSKEGKVLKSLSYPFFNTLMIENEKNYRHLGQPAKIVHDDLKTKDSLLEIFHRANIGRSTPIYLDDGYELPIGLKYIQDVTFVNSNENRWIQISDMLASTVNRILKSILEEKPLDREMQTLFNLLFSLAFVNPPTLVYKMVSTQFEQKWSKIMRESLRW